MRFITILWRNDVFRDPGARPAGAEERPFKLSEKGGWEDWRLFSAELLRLWKAARVRLERPQMKLDICIAFLSVKVTADRQAPREKHKHTHTHILHCRDWMPRCHALCLLCQAIRALKWWQLRNDWFPFFFFFSSCVALTEHSYTVVFVCGVEVLSPDSEPQGHTALFVFAFLIGWLGAARQSEETWLIIHLTGSNNSVFTCCRPLSSWTSHCKVRPEALVYMAVVDHRPLLFSTSLHTLTSHLMLSSLIQNSQGRSSFID